MKKVSELGVHCTYPLGVTSCRAPATTAVKGEGRLFWYRCDEHYGRRANGEMSTVLYEVPEPEGR